MNIPVNKSQMMVTGAVAGAGSFKDDNGNDVKYDNIKFYAQMPLIKGLGYSTVEYKLKNRSHDFEKIFAGVELPALAEVSFIEATDGKGRQIREVVDLVLIKTKA